MSTRLVIARLGQRGDGVADTPDGPLIVPGALPGETVLGEAAEEEFRLLRIETPSPRRVTPPCPLFGRCGGCAVQHLHPDDYRQWKREGVIAALRRAGIETKVAALVPAHGEGRRRVVLHARRSEAGPLQIGFMAARSHRLVPVAACPLLEPALEGAPQAALALATAIGGAKPLDIQLTATLGGLDVDLRGHGPLGDTQRASLSRSAAALGLARLSVHGEVVVERQPALIEIGGIPVRLPPGGFLQATRAGEDALGALVIAAASEAASVADLFAGIGPFALRLARGAEVHAVDSAAGALAALDRAARQAPGLRRVTSEVRDLFRRPLAARELDRFDAVVFDPPRAGAQAQAEQLAAATWPRTAIAVSCNAATFARDTRCLLDGGWRLREVTLIDQFLYSFHLELVGVFERPRAARPRRLLG